ncbi:hypothetical protein HXX76_011729 [Chlamydomonas incerta]|uniref:Importin N-terminal domain-containing protein n=1 Tax=Chlamydomonas incerta TaxID=51695 RepID=A0A835SFY3_CHLIN|nr:hypothetical protein HXX76_011729 [Chlamydomonas incerta]|eukprot:KAG2426502.1 hypothetical protein HXX76_011729 [Chlamydomonas incerta]
MAAGASEATQHVLRCLHTLVYSIDTDARNASEQQLQAAIGHEGYASLLATLSTDGGISDDLGVRQLAAVILKQVIKKHWSAEGPKFEAPELSANERAHIKAVLPAGLAQESSKLRTAVAMCIAAIAKSDPDGWSGLVENLVGAIHTQRATNKALVHGAIRCLALLSDDIDEQQLPQVAQALLPELLAVASDAGGGGPGEAELRAAALSILCDLLKGLGVMAGVYQRQVRDLLVPLVEPWLPLLCAQVAAPLDVEDTAGWATRMLCLRCLTQLVSFFSRPLQGHMQAIMGVCWRMYTQSLPLYTTHLVLTPAEGGQAPDYAEEAAAAAAAAASSPGGAPPLSAASGPATASSSSSAGDGGGAVDAEGNTLDPESLLAQLFELLMALVGLHRYAKLIKPALPEMAHLAVAYMQMTSRQAADWAADAAAYVADEDDSMFTVRVSGELLADSMLQSFGLDAAGALMDAVERRAAEAAAAHAAGQAGWWKLREAALLAAGCCVASFPGGLGGDGPGGDGFGGGGGGGGARQRAAAGALVARLQRLMDEVVTLDLRAGACNPLLVGRALWLAARLQPLLRPDQRPALLQAAAAGLNSPLPPPVKIGACRALASLVGRVPPAVLSGPGPQGEGSYCLSDSLYDGCLALLRVSAEESLNLVLECLVPLIRADPAAAARALPALAPPVLAVWSRHVADPLIAESALEVLAALARVPACLGPLAGQALPVLTAVVRAPAEQPDGLVGACLGLLSKLVRPGRREVVAAAAGAVTGPLLALLPGGAWAGADDSSGGLAHGATELLVELLRAGREEMLVWAAPSLPPPREAGSAEAAAAPAAAAAGGEPAAAAADRVWAALLGACHRLLDPRADEYRTALAGDLAYAAVACLPARAAAQPALGGLLGACAAKLVASNLSPLVGGVIAALSAMALAGGAAGWVEALAALQLTVPAAKSSSGDGQASGSGAATTTTVSALQAVLTIMLERQGCVRGRLASKTACLALLELLGSRHPLLGAVMVRGRRQDLAGGVRTRKQAAAAGGEQWTQVPAAVKMVAVVADLMVEQPWAQGGEDGSFAGEDEEDEAGSFFDDDEEEDEEEEEEEEEGSGDEGAADVDVQGAGAGNGALDLSLAGKRINQQEQAHLDAHINRSRTPAADSALVAGGAADQSAAAAAAAAAAGGGASEGPRDPITDLDLRAAAANTLRSLRAGADTGPLLAMAMELLPPRRQQQVAEALA